MHKMAHSENSSQAENPEERPSFQQPAALYPKRVTMGPGMGYALSAQLKLAGNKFPENGKQPHRPQDKTLGKRLPAGNPSEKDYQTVTADSFDNFEYEPATQFIPEAKKNHYWAVATGLQAVDGLETSGYLRENARAYISGEKTLAETGSLIREYHRQNNDAEHAEADLVSQRIAELLEKGAFFLAPEMLVRIHEYLFQDLDPAVYRPGRFKHERMIKREEILNGDSVLYADPLAYEMSLKGAFSAEAAKSYGTFNTDELKGFCRTIAFLWQIHPFYEGNTRTIAVFSELYLNQLGFDLSNEPFETHARYYREALVRAMYRNASAKIFPDDRFLIRFYENALGFESNELSRNELFCPRLFEDPSLIRNAKPLESR